MVCSANIICNPNMVFYVEGVGPECKAESLRCAPDANGRLVSFRVYVRKLEKVEGEGGGKRRKEGREEEKVRVERTEGEGKRRGGRKGRRRERGVGGGREREEGKTPMKFECLGDKRTF